MRDTAKGFAQGLAKEFAEWISPRREPPRQVTRSFLIVACVFFAGSLLSFLITRGEGYSWLVHAGLGAGFLIGWLGGLAHRYQREVAALMRLAAVLIVVLISVLSLAGIL